MNPEKARTMDVYTGEILKIVRETTDTDLCCYRVYGLSVFSENHLFGEEHKGLADGPLIEFIHALSAGKTLLGLIAYWVVENWKNEKTWGTSQKVSVYDVLGQDVLGAEDKIQDFLPSWHDGQFTADGGSFLFMIHDFKMLSDVINAFTSQGAAGFFVCDTSSTVRDVARLLQKETKTKAGILKNVVDHTVFFISTQHDDPDLKVYSGKRVDEYFGPAIRKAEAVVMQSDWYQQNKSRLVWDDALNHCLIIGKPASSDQP